MAYAFHFLYKSLSAAGRRYIYYICIYIYIDTDIYVDTDIDTYILCLHV